MNTKKRKFNKNKVRKDKVEDKNTEVSKEPAELKNVSRYGNPNWYFLDKDLAEQASRFSFKAFIGDGSFTGDAKLASIATFGLNPFIGTYVENYLNQVSSINMAARKLYARLSSKTGRTSSYGPQDVMTIILAIGEVISITSHLKRVLGLAFKYEYRNRDFPSHIIKALGVNANDLFDKLSVYWVRLNTTLNQINKIPIPADIAWFQKCGSIYSTLFKDSKDEMAQIYAFIPATTWQIDETSYDQGTILSTISACYNANAPENGTVIRTFGEWISILDGMVSAILTSTSYNVIYADIMNLASKDNVALLHLDIIPSDYHVEPEFDPEFLLHVHNLIINKMRNNDTKGMGVNDEIYATPRNDVYPDVNANTLYQYPLIELPGTSGMDNLIDRVNVVNSINVVDFPYGNPDLTERIEATRFSTRYLPIFDKWAADDTNYVTTFGAAGDHYCIGMDLYIAGDKLNAQGLRQSSILPNTTSGLVSLISALDKFDYHPLLYRIGTDKTVSNVIGDVNYFTNLGVEWLRRINDLAFQGLLELRD